MVPSYASGDHVLTFNWSKIKCGDVVVFRSDNKFIIKRVDKIDQDFVHVSGDNKQISSNVKPAKFKDVVGKVILKY